MPSSESRISARLFASALLVSSGLQIAETLLPRIPLFPWLRLGFSWALLLPFLLEFGTVPALWLFTARNLLALSCGAQPLSTFVISTLSGLASLGLVGPPVRALVRLRVKKASRELQEIFDKVEQRAQNQATESTKFESPFSEITDEDIDKLFGD